MARVMALRADRRSSRDAGTDSKSWPRREAGRRQCLQPRHAGIDAACSRITQRSAAKGRKTGTEYHPGIDQIDVCNDTFAQADDALVDQHEHQTVGEIIGRGGYGMVRRAIDLTTGQPVAT